MCVLPAVVNRPTHDKEVPLHKQYMYVHMFTIMLPLFRVNSNCHCESYTQQVFLPVSFI